MKDFSIRNMLRARLTPRKNPQYLAWIANESPSLEGHHFTGSSFKKKLHDLLIIKLPSYIHQQIEAGIPVDGYSEEEQLMECIEWNHKYVIHLQQRITELENKNGING